jgi:signal transduction histidine kinase
VVTDLTEQKRQEAILAEEQLSRAIFEQAEAVIVVVNPEGHIIRASHEAHQICRGNLLLRKFDEVFQLETFDTSGKKSNPAAYGPFSVSFTLQGKIFHGLEVRFYPPEGREPLEMLLNAGPLRGSQGEVLGAVVAMTDITARKRAEAEREMLLADIQVQAEELQVNNEELISQTEELAVQAEELSTQAENLRALSSRLAEVEELERQRLARELHDQVCQNLAIINISLATLTIKAHREPLDKLLSRLADVGALAEQTGEITREIMEGLRPTALDHYGLIGGLHHLGNQFSAQTGIAVNVEGKESARRFAAPVELALFRITQEALANVAKHSRATKVAVCHEEKEDTFYLTIADNGIGFDQDKAVLPTAGCKWGLMNMNERAMAVGGHCQVESHRGKGTRVVVKVRRRALPSS